MLKKLSKLFFVICCLFLITGCVTPTPTPTDNNEIKYALDGGEFVGAYPDSYELGVELELPIPVKEGYTFEGWYLDSKFSDEPITHINEDENKTIKLYAKWVESSLHEHIYVDGKCECGELEPVHVHEYIDGICECGDVLVDKNVIFTIEYETNGGILPDDTKYEYYQGENYELPVAKKAAKEFTGWFDYETGEPVTHVNYGNIKVYAGFKDATVISNIEYVVDGGIMPDEHITSYKEGTTSVLPAPTKEGYYFRGWYTDLELTKKIVAITAKTCGDLTLYAKWEEATMENTNIAIMGDSISTFYSPNSKVNSIWQGENEYYYPKYAPSVSSVSSTWWYQTIEALGANLLVNNSLSGSAVCVGNNKAMDRARILKNMYNNVIPDVLIIYMGVNDGVSKVSQSQFAKGYRQMLDLIKTNFPSCQVFVCTLPYETYTDGTYRAGYNSTIENLAEEYNLPVIDLSNIWDETTEIKNNWHYLSDNIHPGVLGMQKISQQAIKSIKEFYGIE